MIASHLWNQVHVLQPRWSTREILPKVSKFKPGPNLITIKHHNYPSKYYMTLRKAETYPQETKQGRHGEYQVFVIPLAELMTMQERDDIIRGAKEAFDGVSE